MQQVTEPHADMVQMLESLNKEIKINIIVYRSLMEKIDIIDLMQ